MNKHILPILGIFFTVMFQSEANAQEDFNARGFFVEAESYFLFEEYTEALPLYQRILRAEPENYNVMYKIGICYLNDEFQKARSTSYLLQASEHINENYKENSYKEKLAPPEVVYYLGQSYRVTGDINKAIEYYTVFKNNLDTRIYDDKVVNAEIRSCRDALQLMEKEVYVSPENLGEEINSRFSETHAVISGDGRTLVFNRELQFYDAVFISTRNANGKWSAPYNLTPDFAVDGNSFVTGISFNGDEIYIYRSDNFDGNIYKSRLVNGKWQPLEKLNNNINTKYWESHASPSPDGRYLYFTSNREGGYGGLDIYRATKTANGDWSEVVNLGPVINSSSNEDTPFMSSDNSKLFFSSLDHNTMGGYDIFVSVKSNDNSWSKPVNMGYPLNTTDDDLFFCPVSAESGLAVYSKYDESNTLGLRDLYWVEVYNEVLLRTFTLNGKIALPIEGIHESENKLDISLISNTDGKVVDKTSSDDQGNFSLNTTQGNYQLIIEGNRIKPISIPVDLALTQESSRVDLPVLVAEVTKTDEHLTVETNINPPKLEPVGKTNIVTDLSRLSIDFLVEKNSDLKVETFVNRSLKEIEEFRTTRDKFTYIFEPEPGKNDLIFTITDSKGNTTTKEISVYYEPVEIVEPITASFDGQQIKLATIVEELAALSSGNLKDYFVALESVHYASLSELYTMLEKNANDNAYTIDEVNKLMSILLSQRTKQEFIENAKSTEELKGIYSDDSLVSSSDIPLYLVFGSKQDYSENIEDLYSGLLRIVPFEGSKQEMVDYILSFDEEEEQVLKYDLSNSDIENVSLFETLLGESRSHRTIDLASTTQNLDQFYQSMLMNSDENLKSVLLDINFDSLNLKNSVDLVNYLLHIAPQKNIAASDLVQQIESAQQSSRKDILRFKESLANAATGNLKTAISELDINSGEIKKLHDVIDILIRKSPNGGYGRTEVFDLLINMIGKTNVDEFIVDLKKNAEGNLKTIISQLDPAEFSLPIEVIQYLISQAGMFNYTESDINNLLVKMLLEQGLDNWEEQHAKAYEKYIKRRNKIISTGVLAAILIGLIIILFGRKKKKNENE